MQTVEPSDETAAAAAAALRASLLRSGGLLERLPVGVYACDREGRIAHYNARAAELWGQSPGAQSAPRFCGAHKTFTADGAPLAPAQSPAAQVLENGQRVCDCELILEAPDGRRTYVLANAEPLHDEHGVLIGAVTCIQDITKLKDAQAALRASQARGLDMINAMPTPVYATDASGAILFFNAAAVRFWGRTPVVGHDLWCGSARMYTAEGAPLPHDQCPMAIALKTRSPIVGAEAVAERPGGERAPFLAYPSPIFDDNGVMIGAINMLVDISEHKAAQARQKALIDELNHRVKNTLATVQGLAVQSLRHARDPGEAETRFIARLTALSQAHDHLTREAWSGADLAAMLQAVTGAHRERALRIRLDGPPVRAPPRVAVTLALVVNELADNAITYGSLSAESGEAHMSWRVEADALKFDWIEVGGPAAAAPQRSGFGTRMIARAICDELGGEALLSFEPAGLACRLRIPLGEKS